jgi:hypothetical protein
VAAGRMWINLDGPEDDLRLLARWLRDEDELRGRVSLVQRPIEPGQMGGVLETVEVVLTSGTAATLVTSVFAWLTHRKSAGKVSLKIQTKLGENITFTCGSADDAATILASAQNVLDDRD